MSEHSPEPWYVGEDYYGGVSIRTITTPASNIGGNDAIFENTGRSAGDMSPANARRIVACVNACKGIPTETLEKCETSWYVLADAKTVSGINARLAEAEALIRQWLYRVDDKPVMESLAFLKAEAKP